MRELVPVGARLPRCFARCVPPGRSAQRLKSVATDGVGQRSTGRAAAGPYVPYPCGYCERRTDRSSKLETTVKRKPSHESPAILLLPNRSLGRKRGVANRVVRQYGSAVSERRR